MAKKVKRNQKPKKLSPKKCEIKNIEIFCRKLQELFDMFRNDGEILQAAGDLDHTLYINNNKKQTLPRKDTNGGPAYNNNYKCRCKQLAEVTLNMFPSFDKRILSVIGNCEIEVNFIQAVVWLRSVATYIPKISVEKLKQLYNEQGNVRGKYSYDKNKHIGDVRRVVNDNSTCNVESLKNNKASSIHEMFNNSSQVSITSSLENIFPRDVILTPMSNLSCIDFDDIQNETLISSSSALSLEDRSESVAELSKLETGTGCVLKNQEKEKKYLSKPCTIPDMKEHQTSKHVQTSKNSDRRVNNEIIEDKSICFSQNADNISTVSRTELSKSSFSLTCDNFEECITQILNRYGDKMKILDNYSINFPNYNIHFSPMSYLTPLKQNNPQTDQVQLKTLRDYNNDDFENQTSDLCTLMSDVGKESHDSAYSTSENETFNYDTAKTPKPINTSKRIYIPDTNIKNHSPVLIQKKPKEATISPVLKPVYRRSLSAHKLSSSKKRNLISAKEEEEEDLSNKEEENTNKTSSLENIFNSSYDISPIINKYIDPDMQSQTSSFPSSSKDQNESVAELSKPGTSTDCVIIAQEKMKKHLSKPYVISDLEADSFLELSELLEELDDTQEHQTFEYEETSFTNSHTQVNNEIIEDKNTCSTSRNADTDISNEHRSASPATCQSIESVYQINDDNHCISINETASEDHDSAYSTLKIDTLNYDDAAIITKPTSTNKPDTKIEHYYNLRPCKEHKKEMVSPSLVQKPIRTGVSSKKQASSNKRKAESPKKQSSSKKRKVESSKKLSKDKKQKRDKVVISTNLDLKSTTSTNNNNKHIPDTNIGQHYNLRPRKEHQKETVSSLVQKPIRTEVSPKKQSSSNKRKAESPKKQKQNEEETVSLLIQKPTKTGGLSARKQSSSKKRKSKPAKDLTKKNKDKTKTRENDKDEVLSTSWLDFDVKLLNAERVILASVKVILSTVFDKRTAQVFSKYNVCKDSLEELVVNAILNVVNIFKKKKKPDIITKQIEKSIIETLDEMMTSIQLNETSLWIHRIQIILMFCNLLPICVKTINYLIAMLQTLQKILIDAVDRNERSTRIEINQLHLTSYALDIALRKYRVLVPKANKSQPAVEVIPHVGDMWKMHYMDENEKFENEIIDLDATERQWMIALQRFTTASVNYFVQFIHVSLSLYQTLLFA